MPDHPAIRLQPVDSLDITILADNNIDVLLPDQGPAKRVSLNLSQRAKARFVEGGSVIDVPVAQHGFSALVTVTTGGRTHRTLFDTGLVPTGASENMRRLDIDARDIGAIVLSHNHFDHTVGMDGIAQALGMRNLPVIIHPEFWTRRRVNFPGRAPLELPVTSKNALRESGFEIIEDRQPSFLLGGALLVTGEVARTSGFEKGFPGKAHEAWRGDHWEPDPLVLDDQALIAHVNGRGLVVLTGCGHAGIVNIVRHAMQITGESGVYAVMGGFHLSGGIFEAIIQPTVAALREIAPKVIVPAHCTGWKAMQQLATVMPEAFIMNSVGTRFEFRGA